jgi:hypothetical protein
MKVSEIVNNQAAPLTRPAATELTAKTIGKAPRGLQSPAVKAETPTDRKMSFDEALRLDAYLKWEAAGKPVGDGVDFWLKAESDLRQVLATPKLAKG